MYTVKFISTMRLFLAAILCLSLVGCGSGPGKSNFSAPPSNTTPPPSTPPPTANTEVVFIGDSVTDLWRNQAAFQAHTNWTDKGISGQGSQAIAMRFQADVVDLHPDEVHIIAGTNDLQASWTLCPTPGPDDATPTTPPITIDSANTCANMTYMVETAKRNNIKVIIGTIPPWGCASDPACGFAAGDQSQGRLERINTLNTWLKAFAIKEGVTLIDYHAALFDPISSRYTDGLTTDGVHPDASGYAVMQPLVEGKLQQLQ